MSDFYKYEGSTVRPNNYFHEVATGKRNGKSVVNKFGFNRDVDSSSPEIIASFGGTFDPSTDVMTTNDTFDITYNSTTDGSGTTGALSLLVTYVYFSDETTLEESVAVHVLGGDGSDTSSFSGVGINRALVLSNGGTPYNVNDITFTATTDGTTQAQIPASESVTQQLLFHTKTNNSLLIETFFIAVLKLSGGSSPRVKVKGYSYSRVTLTRYNFFEVPIDTSVNNQMIINQRIPMIFTGREVIWFELETNVNNTDVEARFSAINSVNS